jgi:L-methionine (R)-S-oxide reductase
MFENLLLQLDKLYQNEPQLDKALLKTCQVLHENLDSYDWVGFYFMDHQSKKLHLGPYVGEPTDHTIIEFGKGICGQVAVSGKTYLAEDVQAESNYIACSIDVKSEIVVPFYLNNELIGQIDIDSKLKSAFSQKDELFLLEINQLLASYYAGIGKFWHSLN